MNAKNEEELNEEVKIRHLYLQILRLEEKNNRLEFRIKTMELKEQQ